MFFNSFDFAVFLPIVFVLYWFIFNKQLKIQNALLVIASYVFYGWWDWRFLSLILFSTILDFGIGLYLVKAKAIKTKKLLLWISIFVNLGLLGFFKYFNFFIDSLAQSFHFFGQDIAFRGLEIILPVGISFYTFQTLSYTIDVYKGKLEPTRDFFSFAAFVSFFPQLVAGPIERAKHLLPQFYRPRIFNYPKAVDGMRQILWGLFKKIAIADSCAVHANEIFNNYHDYSGSTLFMGALFFTLQIYGDFSGYSDIAIGTSRLFGFDLKRNFAYPYFSRDIAEFWRRWHISLSTWFRDYLYIPLGGSRGDIIQKIRNTFIIFIVSGLWHGANWTFIVWGFLNALYFLPLLLRNKNRVYTGNIAEGRWFPSFKEFKGMIITFFLTLLAWVFFRSENINHAFAYLDRMFSKSLFSIPEIRPKDLLILIFIFFCVEWFARDKEYALEYLNFKKYLRWFVYVLIIILMYLFGSNSENVEFIYFQF